MQYDFDYIIIGSGFGGSVSALRLSEKGYKVLVIEKGKWYESEDFAKTNWNLKKWLWMPSLRFFGIMKMSIFRHIVIISGTGVGGGSLVYANTLPVPKSAFYKSGSWSELVDWETELKPFYQKALKMLGASRNPKLFDGDLALKELAKEIKSTDKKSDSVDVLDIFENRITNYKVGIDKSFQIKNENKNFIIYTNLFYEKTFDFKSLNLSLVIPINDWSIN